MKVTCHVKSVDVTTARAKAAQAKKRATVAMVEAARMDTDPYVPFVTGHMAGTAATASKPEQGLLIYDTEYAQAQYHGLENKTLDSHPLATSQWFEFSKAVNMRRWREVMARVYRKTFGG